MKTSGWGQIRLGGWRCFVAGLLLILVACGARDRINPFDPAASVQINVFDLRVRSDPGSVYLNWQPVDSPDLRGYNIYRAKIPQSLELVARVPDTVHTFHDTLQIQAGATYAYGVSALGQVDETQLSVLDTITPGDSWWWVASDNPNGGALSRLSHDGMHVFESYQYYDSPRFLAAEWDAPVVFVYNSSQRVVYMQWFSDNIQTLASDLYSVRSMVYDRLGRALYFVPEHDTKITVVTVPRGIAQQYQVAEQALVNAVSISRAGTRWIAAGDSLFYFQAGRLHFYYTSQGPSITAIEPVQNEKLMIALETDQSMQRIMPDPETPGQGRLDTTLTAVGSVKEMAFDPENGILWMRSYNAGSQTYEILQSTESGIRKVLTGGERFISMAVNPVSHDCLTADYGTGWMYRITPGGAVRKRMSPVGQIYEIVVQPVGSN